MPGKIGLEGLLSTMPHYLSGRVVVVAEGPRAANDAVAVGTRPVGLPSADNHKVVAGQWIRVPDDDEEEGGGDGDEGAHDAGADGKPWHSAGADDRGVVAGTCK